MTAATLDELVLALVLYEIEADPAGTMDEDQRTNRALDLLAERTKEAEEELTGLPAGPLAPDDWSWPAILVRCRSSAEDQERTTGTTVPVVFVTAAAQLVDLLIEGAAQGNVRDVDLARCCDLPTVALCAVREAWNHPERWRE